MQMADPFIVTFQTIGEGRIVSFGDRRFACIG